MRGTLALAGGVMLTLLLLAGCAKPVYVRSEQRPSYFEAPAGSGGYVKKAAIVVRGGVSTHLGPQVGDLLLQTLSGAIPAQNSIHLLTPRDPDYPAFMKIYHPITGREAFSATQTARRQGFHNLIQGTVENIRVFEEKRGIMWFRKPRNYLTVVISLEVYDTFTGAKIINVVRERTQTIDPDSYAAFLAGSEQSMEALTALIVPMVEKMGKQAGRAIANGKWICSVAEVHNLQVSLTPGLSAGLQIGDRLAIFEGRRIIDGSDGEKFVVPGYKIGEVQVTAVDEHGAKASFDTPFDIRPGDIAVPAI